MNRRKPRKDCKTCGEVCSRPEKVFCSIQCHLEFRSDSYIDRWKQGLESGAISKGNFTLSHTVRNYLIRKNNHKCSSCGWSKENPTTKKVPLQIDHIDGNSRNCRPENLRVLCPNCHSLTPTFGSLNKGNGRSGRYKCG